MATTTSHEREYRTVRKPIKAGDAVIHRGTDLDVTDIPNRRSLIEAGYLSREYRMEVV